MAILALAAVLAAVRAAAAPPDRSLSASGTVERVCGEFRDPQELAYGRSGEPKQVLYRVRFAQRDVWPDYAGAADDTIDIELYEPWLEAAR